MILCLQPRLIEPAICMILLQWLEWYMNLLFFLQSTLQCQTFINVYLGPETRLLSIVAWFPDGCILLEWMTFGIQR